MIEIPIQLNQRTDGCPIRITDSSCGKDHDCEQFVAYRSIAVVCGQCQGESGCGKVIRVTIGSDRN